MDDALTKALAKRLGELAERAATSAAHHESAARHARHRATALGNLAADLRDGATLDADLLLAVAYPPMLAPLFPGTRDDERPDPLAALLAPLGKEPTP